MVDYAAAIQNAADHLRGWSRCRRATSTRSFLASTPRDAHSPAPDDAFAHLITRRHRVQHMKKLAAVEGQLEYARNPEDSASNL